VKIFEKLLRIVALVNVRIFVGQPLSRDEEQIKLTINYTFDCPNAIKDVGKIPSYLRLLRVPFTPSIPKAMEYRRKVAEKLKPQLNEMIQASKRIQKEDEDDHFDVLPDDHHSLATRSLISPLWEDSSSIPPTLILIDWKSTSDTEHKEITKE